jgi:hypothetical protein
MQTVRFAYCGTTINIDVQKMQIASYPIIYLQQQETRGYPEG